jgi:hypothetical protein
MTLISRGDVEGVKAAVEVRGLFQLSGNHISGFDEKASSALCLLADPLGRVTRGLYWGNVFERCAAVVPESKKALWAAVKSEGKLMFECGGGGR